MIDKIAFFILILLLFFMVAILAFAIPHDEALMFVIQHEGGLSKEPEHAGGKSYAGITQNNWMEWRVKQGDAVHLPLQVEMLGGNNPFVSPLIEKTANLAVIKRFYYDYYADYHCWDLISSFQLAYCDGVTLTGHEAVRLIQQVVGIKVDGRWGDGTARAVRVFNQHVDGDRDAQWKAFQEFDRLKRDFFNQLVKRHPENQKHLKGWLSRSDDVRARTRELIYGAE